MASYAEVFKRKEVKYVLNAQQRKIMEAECDQTMEVDVFGCSRVTSLYYDTPDWTLIERSLDKPLYKEKLRVRWYGEIQEDGLPAPSAQVFVELKKKFKGIVYKRRLSCSFAAARAFLDGEGYLSALNAYPLADALLQEKAYSPQSMQIASEIKAFMDRYDTLKPAMLVTCERTALTPKLLEGETHDMSVQDDVRITFDENICFRNVAGASERWCPITDPGQAVMEIKVAGPYPRWLLRAVSCAQARPSSFSKYGKAYTVVQNEARAAVMRTADEGQSIAAFVGAHEKAVGVARPSRGLPWATGRQVGSVTRHTSPLCNLKSWVQTAISKKEKHYV